jgi:hypothetical protein
MELSSQAAAQVLIKRHKIRLSLAEWARYKGFEPARHHLLIIDEIEAFLESDDEVLLLFAPPGSAKSTYVSVLLPSWYLASNPSHSILAATHSVEFAERWGRRVRNDIACDGNVLGSRLLMTARRQRGGRSKVGASIMALALEPTSRASVQTLAWLTTCLARGRTRGVNRSDRNAGTGMRTTFPHV